VAPDEPTQGDGRVVIDLSHNNNLLIDDLTPLQNALDARGVPVRIVDGFDLYLEDELFGATGLVVLAPTFQFSPSERRAVEEFVADGGRLLMAADPTRAVVSEIEDEFLDLNSIFFSTSAIPAINSLANLFDILYFDDYLYNPVENEGNYRNVQFSDLDESHPVMEGLTQVVFFASHSLISDGAPLVIGDENTHSNVRTGEVDLVAAVTTSEGRVVALGDLTSLTSPYQAVADNELFVGNIADWLALDSRVWDLTDFPYLFERPVDLVQISEGDLDPRLLPLAVDLEPVLEALDLDLSLRREVDPTHDVLRLGSFADFEVVEEILVSKGVTITLATDEEDSENDDEVSNGEIEEAAEEKPLDLLEVQGLGAIGLSGTTVYVVDRTDAQVTVVALAENQEEAIQAVRRLSMGDFPGCIHLIEITVCSTGEAPPEVDVDVEQDMEEPFEEPIDEGFSGGSLFILSDDDGTDGVRTGAFEFEIALSGLYSITVWSTSLDGIPTNADLEGYDAYIVDSGDYAFDFEEVDTFLALSELEAGVMFIGAQPLPAFDDVLAPLEDLEVTSGDHPLALGFFDGEIITLLESESGIPALVIAPDDEFMAGSEGTSSVFVRGPASEEAGAPVVLAVEEEGQRVIFAAVAFYRLPDDIRFLFALNAVDWLLGE
jgi:hypothetical protein